MPLSPIFVPSKIICNKLGQTILFMRDSPSPVILSFWLMSNNFSIRYYFPNNYFIEQSLKSLLYSSIISIFYIFDVLTIDFNFSSEIQVFVKDMLLKIWPELKKNSANFLAYPYGVVIIIPTLDGTINQLDLLLKHIEDIPSAFDRVNIMDEVCRFIFLIYSKLQQSFIFQKAAIKTKRESN